MSPDLVLRIDPTNYSLHNHYDHASTKHDILDDDIHTLDCLMSGTDKFTRYDSSSESSPSSIEEDEDVDLVVDQVRINSNQSPHFDVGRADLFPLSNRLDPFAVLPVALDRFQENLISFYLTEYPKTTYGLSPNLKPHPVAVNFSIALTTPARFQTALARSAFYRVSLGHYASQKELQDLQVAIVHHKGEAIRILRELSAKADSNEIKESEDLLASMIGLGTLDRRMGSSKAASMHYQAARRMLRALGGPLQIKSATLSRVMVHFECIYGTTPESYIWDRSDLSQTLTGFNSFFHRIWTMSKNMERRKSITLPIFTKARKRKQVNDDQRTKMRDDGRLHTFGPRDDSCLLTSLARTASNAGELSQGDRLELICQLTIALTLSTIMLDFSLDQSILQSYMDRFHDLIEESQLRDQPANNILWLLQVHDHSDQHSKRIWEAASWVWVLKHVSYNVQTMIKDYLLKFLLGQPLQRVFKLDSFHFSYAN